LIASGHVYSLVLSHRLAMKKRFIDFFASKPTRQTWAIIITGNICAVIFIVSKLPIPVTGMGSAYSNFMFALTAISGIAMGLSFTSYEIDELVAKKEQISRDPGITPYDRDIWGGDIAVKIATAKKTAIYYGNFFAYITVVMAGFIILNEFLPAVDVCRGGIRWWLRAEGVVILVMLMWHMLRLQRSKKRFIDMATSAYDESIERVKKIRAGDYTDLLPPN
jgi:hypothetical protein